jgi:hypothetical protein
MPDYNKIAEQVKGPDEAETAAPRELFPADREYLPLNHPKYQGIGEAKGYKQEDYSGNRLERVHNIHEAMIDFMVLNPTVTQNDIAKQFDRSVGWVSILINSDSFQAALSKRRDDLLDPVVVASIEEKMKAMVSTSVDVVLEKLQLSRNTDLALKSLEIGSKALGFGARGVGGNQTNNQFVIHLPQKSESSEAWNETYNAENVRRLPSGTDD